MSTQKTYEFRCPVYGFITLTHWEREIIAHPAFQRLQRIRQLAWTDLLRDSLHIGVDYGRYDWRRLVQTVEAVPSVNEGGPRLGVAEGGWHAAEGLILARYFMFTQVYFHKTRIRSRNRSGHVARQGIFV